MKDAISNKAQVRATLPLNEIGDQNISSLYRFYVSHTKTIDEGYLRIIWDK